MALQEIESFDTAAQAKRNLRAAIERVAARLGNTPTICRKCYVHPEVLDAYLDGNLVLEIKSKVENTLRDELAGLQPEEAAVLALLRARLDQAAKDGPSLRPLDAATPRASWSLTRFRASVPTLAERHGPRMR